ncbi:hypothetical protein ADICEAN_02818 [Cesiribacter andamanensis AMV16]|uniref:Uncharacterized protein n=2 Tax=Cesiribacter TaxID=1133570 RepID=M7N489_9BACT|nr:hypothetical protein ADICEAN_02818 [Cesiribacter andamanensis AMV16]
MAIGTATTLILYLFFTYFREILRLQLFHRDLLLLTSEANLAYDLFFAAAAGAAGFAHTVWFWFHNPFAFRLSRRWVQSIRIYAILWMLLLLLLVMRMGSLIGLFLAQMTDFEDHFTFYRDMAVVLILLPLAVFLLIWVPIQLKYRAGKWVGLSLLVYGTSTFILGISSPVDHSLLDNAWHRINAPYHAIVDTEVGRASEKGIILSAEAIATLRLKYTHSVNELAVELKESFKQQTPISGDSLVMELILVKRATIQRLPSSNWDDQESLWPFALPRDVYHQIRLSRDSIHTGYLYELLHEYQSLFVPIDPWNIEDEGMQTEALNRYLMQQNYREIAAETTQVLDLLQAQ